MINGVISFTLSNKLPFPFGILWKPIIKSVFLSGNCGNLCPCVVMQWVRDCLSSFCNESVGCPVFKSKSIWTARYHHHFSIFLGWEATVSVNTLTGLRISVGDEVKLKRHRETYAQTRAIVFCVRCGSTTVDQNFTTELRCYECGTTLEWNSRKFSIRRDPASGEGDVLAAFRSMRKEITE